MSQAWTTELTRRVWRMHADGMTGVKIAAELGLSRGTVLGKLHREKIKRGHVPRSPSEKGSDEQTLRSITRRTSVSRSGPQIQRAVTARREAVERRLLAPKQRAEGGVAFLDLRHGECRWPVGEGLFCSAPVLRLRSYCETHRARAVITPRGSPGVQVAPLFRRGRWS